MLPDDIKEKRRGRITASEAHCIMTGWDAKQPSEPYPHEIYQWIGFNGRRPLVKEIDGFLPCDVNGKLIDAAWKSWQFDNAAPPQGLVTHAERLACEELFEPDPDAEERTTVHMDNGNEREQDAVDMLSDATGLAFVKTGDEQIHLTVDDIGGTPDGLVYDDMDLIVTGCEAKCRSALHHARQLFINDNASLLELDFNRFCQIQVCCLIADVDHWYSVSHHPHAIKKWMRFHYCIIQRDDAFLKIFLQRAALVFKLKAEFINRLNNLENTKLQTSPTAVPLT